MFTAISKILETWEKIEEFGGEPEFLLKPLNGIEQLELGDIVAKTRDIGIFNSEVCQYVCNKGLKGWRNLKDSNGAIVDYQKDISILPHGAIRAIAIGVVSKSEMSQEDEKKSS